MYKFSPLSFHQLTQLMKQKDPCIVIIQLPQHITVFIPFIFLLMAFIRGKMYVHTIIDLMISFSSHLRKCVCVCMFVFIYCKLWESLKLDTCSGAEL